MQITNERVAVSGRENSSEWYADKAPRQSKRQVGFRIIDQLYKDNSSIASPHDKLMKLVQIVLDDIKLMDKPTRQRNKESVKKL